MDDLRRKANWLKSITSNIPYKRLYNPDEKKGIKYMKYSKPDKEPLLSKQKGGRKRKQRGGRRKRGKGIRKSIKRRKYKF